MHVKIYTQQVAAARSELTTAAERGNFSAATERCSILGDGRAILLPELADHRFDINTSASLLQVTGILGNGEQGGRDAHLRLFMRLNPAYLLVVDAKELGRPGGRSSEPVLPFQGHSLAEVLGGKLRQATTEISEEGLQGLEPPEEPRLREAFESTYQNLTLSHETGVVWLRAAWDQLRAIDETTAKTAACITGKKSPRANRETKLRLFREAWRYSDLGQLTLAYGLR